jgi:hypothetical protein
MTLCPVALAVGCKKCPIFSVCPLTRVIGDQPAAAPARPESPAPKAQAGRKAPGRKKR